MHQNAANANTSQARSASSLTGLSSPAGADFDGIEHVFTSLKSLDLAGPLPPAPLPQGLTSLSIRCSEATADAPEELRLLLQGTLHNRQRGHPTLPALSQELQHYTQLNDLTLTHFHLPRDVVDLLPASVQSVALRWCIATSAFPPEGWKFFKKYVPPWEISLLKLACGTEDDIHAVEVGKMWRPSS